MGESWRYGFFFLINVVNADRTCSRFVEYMTVNGIQTIEKKDNCISVAYCCDVGCCYLYNLWYFWFILILVIVGSCSGCCYYAYRKKKRQKFGKLQ